MKKLLLVLFVPLLVACADFTAPYEVKVNLDPDATPAILDALTEGAKIDQRTSIFYRIEGAAPNSIAIVRLRRTAKKTDITVKLRGLHELSANVLSSTTLGPDDVDFEYDAKLREPGEGKLSGDIKIDHADTTFSTDGATVRALLTPDQRELLAIGARRPFHRLALVECPGVTATLYKDLPPPSGCDEATVEYWPFPDRPLYELSCNTETLDDARAGLEGLIAQTGATVDSDQRGKTERSLALCQ